MTLLERKDDNASAGTSYFELIPFIIESGSKTTENLEELWKRIVFSP